MRIFKYNTADCVNTARTGQKKPDESFGLWWDPRRPEASPGVLGHTGGPSGSGFDVRVAGVGLTAARRSADVPGDAAVCRAGTQGRVGEGSMGEGGSGANT